MDDFSPHDDCDSDSRTATTCLRTISNDDDLTTYPIVTSAEIATSASSADSDSVTFDIWLDTARAQSASPEGMVACVLDAWVREYCVYLCGGDTEAGDALHSSISSEALLDRTFSAKAIESIGTADIDIDPAYTDLCRSFLMALSSRVEDTALDASPLTAVREHLGQITSEDASFQIPAAPASESQAPNSQTQASTQADAGTVTHRLQVRKAYSDDSGCGIARLDPTTLLDAGLTPGDYVQIDGDDRTAAKTWRANRKDWDDGIVRIDGFTRDNAAVALGESVTVRPADPAAASRVVLAPPAEDFDRSVLPTQLVKRQLLTRPLAVGDTVPVVVPDRITWSRSHENPLTFQLQRSEPDGLVHVTEETVVELASGADEPCS